MPLRDIQPWNWWFLSSKICLFTQEATTPLPNLICKLQFSALRIHFASQKHISSTNCKSNKEISIALPQNCTRLITTWLPSLQKMYFYCFVIFFDFLSPGSTFFTVWCISAMPTEMLSIFTGLSRKEVNKTGSNCRSNIFVLQGFRY